VTVVPHPAHGPRIHRPGIAGSPSGKVRVTDSFVAMTFTESSAATLALSR
jgi:hypothetical protein